MTDSQTNNFIIGNQPVVNLHCSLLGSAHPQFLQATILPGIGMNLLQIKAFIPNYGEIDLLHSPALGKAKEILEDSNDLFHNAAFMFGSALLLPFANRIRGELSSDGRLLKTTIAGQKICLPANWQGQQKNAEKHAIHGLVYAEKFTIKERCNSQLSGELHTNFHGHWPGQAKIRIDMDMSNTSLIITVTTTNTDEHQLLPVGIGLHPYFSFPSQSRQQVTLYLPARKRVAINNYQDIFPTGELQEVKNSDFDFSMKGGRRLDDLYLDDCFTDLSRDARGLATAAIIDDKANYGLKIHLQSSAIKAIQVYAPTKENFIAIEPQFNLADPYNPIWGETDTGMVLLAPGQTTTWQIGLELFDPSQRNEE